MKTTEAGLQKEEILSLWFSYNEHVHLSFSHQKGQVFESLTLDTIVAMKKMKFKPLVWTDKFLLIWIASQQLAGWQVLYSCYQDLIWLVLHVFCWAFYCYLLKCAYKWLLLWPAWCLSCLIIRIVKISINISGNYGCIRVFAYKQQF